MSKLLLSEIRRQHRGEHAELDDLMGRVLAIVHRRGPTQLDEAWSALERRLNSHLALEEQSLFPLVEERHAKEVEELREEHTRIRALVGEIGLALRMNVLGKDVLERLATLLAEHGAREDTSLGLWLDEMAPMDDRRHLPRLFVQMMRAELRAG